MQKKKEKKKNVFWYIRELDFKSQNNLVHIEFRFQNLVMQHFYKR